MPTLTMTIIIGNWTKAEEGKISDESSELKIVGK